jgi:hypothetical protein
MDLEHTLGSIGSVQKAIPTIAPALVLRFEQHPALGVHATFQ